MHWRRRHQGLSRPDAGPGLRRAASPLAAGIVIIGIAGYHTVAPARGSPNVLTRRVSRRASALFFLPQNSVSSPARSPFFNSSGGCVVPTSLALLIVLAVLACQGRIKDAPKLFGAARVGSAFQPVESTLTAELAASPLSLSERSGRPRDYKPPSLFLACLYKTTQSRILITLSI